MLLLHGFYYNFTKDTGNQALGTDQQKPSESAEESGAPGRGRVPELGAGVSVAQSSSELRGRSPPVSGAASATCRPRQRATVLELRRRRGEWKGES